MKLLSKESVIAEALFQKGQFFVSSQEAATIEEVKDLALSYFDTITHGIEEHMDQYQTIEEAANQLGVKKEELEELVQTGEIKVVSSISLEQVSEETMKKIKTLQQHK